MPSDKPMAVIGSPSQAIHIHVGDGETVECGKYVPIDERQVECELGKLQLLVAPEAPMYVYCPNCLGAYLARLADRIEQLEAWSGAAEPKAWEAFLERVASGITELAEAELHASQEGEA